MSDLALLNIYKTHANLAVSLDATSPIHGSGSLAVTRLTSSAGSVCGVINSGARQFTSGRLRCTCKHAAVTNGGQVALASMLSQEDVTQTAGLGYLCQAQFNYDGSGNNRIQLLKITAGMQSGLTVIATGPNFTLGQGVVMTMQFSWTLDPVNYGGVLLHVQKGSLPDFSDLAAVSGLTYVAHTSGYLTGTVGEGFVTTHSTLTGTLTVDRLHSRRTVVGG